MNSCSCFVSAKPKHSPRSFPSPSKPKEPQSTPPKSQPKSRAQPKKRAAPKAQSTPRRRVAVVEPEAKRLHDILRPQPQPAQPNVAQHEQQTGQGAQETK